MSIRIVKVRGRKYAQEVEYRWDPVKKVGKTIVLKHLGPLKPLNPERYINANLNISTSKYRKRERRKNNPPIKKNIEELNKSYLPPLTPPSDIIATVLKSVRESEELLSRKDLYNLISHNIQRRAEDPLTLKMHIGFALTILYREGKLSRTGKGNPGDPYLYS